ncbi:MAG: HAD-IA family hydrolase [Anaerolineae bacterium]
MRFEHLIWDFDGTLFDTYPPLINSIECALAEFEAGVPRTQIMSLLSDTLATGIQELSAQLGLDATALEERVIYYQRKVTARDQPPFKGVIHLCERFVKAGGQNFLFTHRSRDSVSYLLEWYRVQGLFVECLTVEDGFPRKPDPAGFNALIERHVLPRERVLAIGDRTLDVVAGRRAGISTCLFRGNPDPACPPDFTIASFEELKNILLLPA